MTQLKNKWNVLKSMWQAWVILKNKTSGWGWDTTLGTIDAPSPEHWSAFVKKHPHAKHFKNAPLQNEEALCDLFEGVVADGEGAIGINESKPPPTTPKGISAPNSVVNLEELELEELDRVESADDEPKEVSERKQKHKRRSSSSRVSSKRLRSDNHNLEEALSRMICAEENKNLHMQALVELKRADSNSEKLDTTFDMAYQIVNSLEGIEFGSHTHVMAMEVLEDRNKRQAFISMHESIRLPWLLRAIEKKAADDYRS